MQKLTPAREPGLAVPVGYSLAFRCWACLDSTTARRQKTREESTDFQCILRQLNGLLLRGHRIFEGYQIVTFDGQSSPTRC
jgi:hypothetical protein